MPDPTQDPVYTERLMEGDMVLLTEKAGDNAHRFARVYAPEDQWNCVSLGFGDMGRHAIPRDQMIRVASGRCWYEPAYDRTIRPIVAARELEALRERYANVVVDVDRAGYSVFVHEVGVTPMKRTPRHDTLWAAVMDAKQERWEG